MESQAPAHPLVLNARAILIFDTWHPALTRAERELVRAAVPAIKDYYRDEVPAIGSEQ